MSHIRFANGASYPCSLVSTVPEVGTQRAIIVLDGVTFPEAAAIFSNEDMTREMFWGRYRLVGYTKLLSVTNETYGIQAMLIGGHDEQI